MPDQQEFTFDGEGAEPVPSTPETEDAWGEAREAALSRLENRFGLVINRRVRLTLRDMEEEFIGEITMDELIPPENRRNELILRIGSTMFDWRDIESCVVL